LLAAVALDGFHARGDQLRVPGGEAHSWQRQVGGTADSTTGLARVEHAQVTRAGEGGRVGSVVEAQLDGVDVGVQRDDALLVGTDAAERYQVEWRDVETTGYRPRYADSDGWDGGTVGLQREVNGVPDVVERRKWTDDHLGSVLEDRVAGGAPLEEVHVDGFVEAVTRATQHRQYRDPPQPGDYLAPVGVGRTCVRHGPAAKTWVT